MADDGLPRMPVWIEAAHCSLTDFRAQVERSTAPASVPLAASVAEQIPIYDAGRIRAVIDDPDRIRAVMAEWNRALATGPGIIAVRNAIDDMGVLDGVTDVLNRIIAEEASSAAGSGDHFAPAGANSRVWNAHEKLCLAAPELFARYTANPIVPLASRSWLGPRYQITTQVNVVRPGGKAQICHRDYHMGFQTEQDLVQYPASVHALSPALTLQGAVAHTDMPVVSGPTKLLPYSQTYLPGYLAALQPAFRDYFEAHCVQLPLAKGDMLFFNPAVFHAAGENRSADIQRMANLMQIGSGYGRSIETVDRGRMSVALYPTLRRLKDRGALDDRSMEYVIEACAEGYPFPTNLDIDSPLTGLAPPSQQDLLRQALGEGWDEPRFAEAIRAQEARRLSH